MLVEAGRHVSRRNAAEAAIGSEPEFRQILARQRDALLEAVHMMDNAEIDARAAWPQILQRREKGFLHSGQTGEGSPTDEASGRLDGGVGKLYGRRKIGGRETRPAAE